MVANTQQPAAWIVRPRPRPSAKVRLLCFPYAGAGASAFRLWPDGLPPEVEVCAVQLPGRESRFREPPYTDLRSAAAAVATAVLPSLRAPFALFGHSMGALMAYEFALRGQAAGVPPAHVFVSGRRAPHLPERFPLLCPLPDDEFLRSLEERYGGMAAGIRASPDLVALLLPTLRADVFAVESYQGRTEAPILAPMTALGGEDDPFATRDEMAGWQRQADKPLTTTMLPGGHLFLNTHRQALLALVRGTLGQAGLLPG